jgi:Holliday junction resolvase
MRRAARVDANQTEIVAAFRKRGWSVLIISQLKNCCDIFVAKGGRTIAVEIKDGTKAESAQKLTSGELAFFESWKGELAIIKSVDDVIKCDEQPIN